MPQITRCFFGATTVRQYKANGVRRKFGFWEFSVDAVVGQVLNRAVNIRPILASVLTAILLTQPTTLQAATHYIGVDDLGFFSDSLTIAQGDEVVWFNADEFFSHTTTSTLPFTHPDYWHTILVDQFDAFAKTFNNLGTFNYTDQFEGNFGSITVVVPPPAGITLETPRMEAGQFLFDVTGLTAGKSHVLQTSTNLTSWTSLSTNIATSSTVTFTNSAPTGTRFFQVYEIP